MIPHAYPGNTSAQTHVAIPDIAHATLTASLGHSRGTVFPIQGTWHSASRHDLWGTGTGKREQKTMGGLVKHFLSNT